MVEWFETVFHALTRKTGDTASPPLGDPVPRFEEARSDSSRTLEALNAAFLIALSGERHAQGERAVAYLEQSALSSDWREVARFYLDGLNRVRGEVEGVCRDNSDFARELEALADWASEASNLLDKEDTTEKVWSVFFPEAAGVRADRQGAVEALRERRTVTVSRLNDDPVCDPAREVLFTSNILLTLPLDSAPRDAAEFSPGLREKLEAAQREPQLFWYDHPIPIGVRPENNEILHGLRGLQEAVDFEVARGTTGADAEIACALSVSVTHEGLQPIARKYIEEECARDGNFKRLRVHVFTEQDTRKLVEEILAPAAKDYLKRTDADELFKVLGVDGAYGRHYAFLKAIAAIWHVLVQPRIRSTFKIDLDQTFAQKELVEETGASAFEHLATPLWGARGVDSAGRAVELGLIAGALVNESDIGGSLFTPDVRFPGGPGTADEHIFFSRLPQALSTEAEMMTRYGAGGPDGTHACIERIHVTGGTNGILVDSLRRHRPFVPSFFGRAEDQAYILSRVMHADPRLAYVHKDGLVMRHDKEAFAQEAMESSYVGKLLGDYVRILYFSAYARVLAQDVGSLKRLIDPFTGGFVSRIPVTVTYLRFALKAAGLFGAAKTDDATEFVESGASRLSHALAFTRGENSKLRQAFMRERAGWDLFYETLAALEQGIARENPFALALKQRACEIVAECAIET